MPYSFEVYSTFNTFVVTVVTLLKTNVYLVELAQNRIMIGLPMENITIKGAKEHNLKNVDLTIPKNKLVVFTGLSGSGKSSLAFDTIYAEGQRRYVESLSAYARQFLGMMEKPDVDQIDGLSPAISIDQKTVSHNPRSTVGTTTEVYDYLRLLFARAGHPHCPNCKREIKTQSAQQIVEAILSLFMPSTKGGTGTRVMILAPLVKDRKGEYSALLDDLVRRGYSKARIDGIVFDLDLEDITLIKTNRHTIETIVDRVVITKDTPSKRLSDSVEKALKLSNGSIIVCKVTDKGFDFPNKPVDTEDHLFSEGFACPNCNISLPDIEPRTFSFNNPHGACPTCSGLGTKYEVDAAHTYNPELTIDEGGLFPWARAIDFDSYPKRFLLNVAKQYPFTFSTKIKNIPVEALEKILTDGIIPYLTHRYNETDSDDVRKKIEQFMISKTCPTCNGARLRPETLGVTVHDKNISEITALSIGDLNLWMSELSSSPILSENEKIIAKPIIRELESRVRFLNNVGLDYLTLNRTAATLSGGESQRIRLASQIGSGLSGVLYVLDEPSIGLHPRDHHRLLNTLKGLRQLGNTVIIVEHDMDTMMEADWMADFGPGAGDKGGQVIATGTPSQIMANPNSVTGAYMTGKKVVHPHTHQRSQREDRKLILSGASENNLKNVTAEFPLENFIVVTGVSGSGKSTLIVDTLYKRLAVEKNKAKQNPANHTSLEGLEFVDKVIEINQQPIGRTPRSNPATYTGVFTPIRELFASMPEAQARGYKPGRFSFNVKGGRCENCEGDGQIKIEMQFLPDVYVTCEVCNGSRFNRESLDIKFKDKDISEVLHMTIEEAYDFFKAIPAIKTKLKTLLDVGLGYITLGQPAPTLSGGEAQRIKLSSELSKRSTGKTVYILDEPTTGLHFADIDKLLEVLHELVEQKNTVIVIEHNLDVIKTADWIIDLGPEGGDRGGRILATGTPQDIMNDGNSYTGEYLKKYLKDN